MMLHPILGVIASSAGVCELLEEEDMEEKLLEEAAPVSAFCFRGVLAFCFFLL